MFKKIYIENFRSIDKLEFDDLQQVNLIVGENNSGKSTLLESIFLLISPTNPRLYFNINAFRGIELFDLNALLLNFREMKEKNIIKLIGELDPFQRRELTIKPYIESNPNFISDNQSLEEPMAMEVKSKRVNGLLYESSFSLSRIRKGKRKKPQDKEVKFRVIPDSNGLSIQRSKDSDQYTESLDGVFVNSQNLLNDIAARFNNVQLKKEKNRIINVLKKIMPSLIDITLGNEGIIYCDIGYDRYLPLNVMGDGMIHILAIVLALSNSQNGVVLIDEIETGFYFDYQELLWDTIFETAKEFNVQVFATTHSLECVNALINSYTKFNSGNLRLFRIENRQKEFKIKAYGYEKLKTSIEGGWEVR
ncbi:MAG: AAA family ATPase [Methanobacterium sp.]